MLLGAALLFWSWQTDLVLIGALLAVVLESAPWVQARWEFSDRDFRRIWTFCTLLLLAAAIYAFTANEGPEQFLLVFRNPRVFTQPNAGTASAKTAAALIGCSAIVCLPGRTWTCLFRTSSCVCSLPAPTAVRPLRSSGAWAHC